MHVSDGLLENKEVRFNVSAASNLGYLIHLQSGLKNIYDLLHFLL